MKTRVVTSAILHGLVLGFALVTIGTPESFKVEDFEAMPVDLVPIEEITQMQQGDKTAQPNDKPAPKPTTKPTKVENAENMGENDTDLKSPPIPNAKPTKNESTAAPKASEKPLPQNDPVPNEVKEIMKEETEVEQRKEVASIPETKPEVTPTPPKPDQKPADEAEPEKPDAEALPDNVPVPAAKPQVKPEPKPAEKPSEKKPEQQKTADKPTDKKKDDKKQEKAKSSSSKASDFNADDIAALLNKQDPSNGGAKRSTDVASLGAKKSTNGTKLSMSEMDALRNAIAGNWQIIPGLTEMDQVRITVHMKLDENGEIIGDPEVKATGGNESTRRALAGGAYRAVKRSAPFTNLPKDKYDAWSEVIVNFDPSEMAL